MKIKGNVGPENELTYDLQPSTSDDFKKYSIKVTATSKITTFSHTFTVFFTYKKVISWTKAQESGINPGRKIVQDMRNELRRWISDPNGNNWRLCYSAKRDGYNSEKFHNQCDGRGKLFMQIHRPDNGRYFGAVSDRSWQNNRGYMREGSYNRDLPFLWTVRPDPDNNDKPRLYFHRKCCSRYSYYWSSGHFMTYGGGHDFYCNRQLTSCQSNLGHSYNAAPNRYGTSTARSWLSGSNNWNQAAMKGDVEVFLID